MRRVGAPGLVLGLALASCAVPPPPQPQGPVLGYWHGEPPGPDSYVPETVDLTLFGSRGGTTGTYLIATDVRALTIGGGEGSGLSTWSGTWTRQPEDYAGQRQSVITLHHALARDINQYAIASDGSLQPTSAYVGRPLTRQEIALFTLQPVRGTGRALLE